MFVVLTNWGGGNLSNIVDRNSSVVSKSLGDSCQALGRVMKHGKRSFQ